MMEIRVLQDDAEIEAALNLAASVFQVCNAPAYTQAGTDSFTGCLVMFRIFPVLTYWGCYVDGRLVGMLGAQEEHITLLFVDPLYQGRGIGRALVGDRFSSVKAFPGSLEFYGKMGFIPTGEPLDEDGITYVMMHRG